MTAATIAGLAALYLALVVGALALVSALAFVAGLALAGVLASLRALCVPLLALTRHKWDTYCHARTQTAEVSDQPGDVPPAEQTHPPQVSGTGHHPAPRRGHPRPMDHLATPTPAPSPWLTVAALEARLHAEAEAVEVRRQQLNRWAPAQDADR